MNNLKSIKQIAYIRNILNQKSYKGIFNPVNKDKYIGKFPINFKSGYELKFMQYCDLCENIKKWGYETHIIEYVDFLNKTSDNSPIIRRYFTDFYVEYYNPINNQIKKCLIEIKSSNQVKPPIRGKNKETLLEKQKIFIKNMEKWKAAKEYCKKHNMDFYIITEQQLNKSNFNFIA